MEQHEMRTRSFRNEDYNNRRVFLRSYPLQWGDEEKENAEEEKGNGLEEKENGEEMASVSKASETKKPIKKIILSVFHWGGGKILVLRRFKHKLEIFIIACIPVAFKPPTALISA